MLSFVFRLEIKFSNKKKLKILRKKEMNDFVFLEL